MKPLFLLILLSVASLTQAQTFTTATAVPSEVKIHGEEGEYPTLAGALTFRLVGFSQYYRIKSTDRSIDMFLSVLLKARELNKTVWVRARHNDPADPECSSTSPRCVTDIQMQP